MGIHLTFTGDVDRLPHKDLAEHIIREVNEAVRAASLKAGVPGDHSQGWAKRTVTEVRSEFLGSEPYRLYGESTEAEAHWGVHLPDTIPDPVAAAPEIGEKS